MDLKCCSSMYYMPIHGLFVSSDVGLNMGMEVLDDGQQLRYQTGCEQIIAHRHRHQAVSRKRVVIW